MSALYPISINLRNRRCLVVGGGLVGSRKISALIECGAKVDLISPIASEPLKKMTESGEVRWIDRAFEPSDIDGYLMVFACTNDSKINHEIFKLCEEANILVNTVDDPPNCNFFVPAVLRRGALSIAISTEGSSPLLARRIREKLEQQFPAEYGDYLEILNEARSMVKASVPEEASRRELFERLLDVEIFPLLEQRKKEEAKGRILQCIYSWPD